MLLLQVTSNGQSEAKQCIYDGAAPSGHGRCSLRLFQTLPPPPPPSIFHSLCNAAPCCLCLLAAEIRKLHWKSASNSLDNIMARYHRWCSWRLFHRLPVCEATDFPTDHDPPEHSWTASESAGDLQPLLQFLKPLQALKFLRFTS